MGMAPLNSSRLYDRFKQQQRQDDTKQIAEDLKNLAEEKTSEVKFNKGTKTSGFNTSG